MSKEEAEAIKAELRSLGGANFMRKYVQGDTQYSLEDVLYAFEYVLVRLNIGLVLTFQPEGLEFPPETLVTEMMRLIY
jgi:hypothetical protein